MFETKQFVQRFLPTTSEGKESKAALKSHCQIRGKNCMKLDFWTPQTQSPTFFCNICCCLSDTTVVFVLER